MNKPAFLVYVVDDDEHVCRALARLLRLAGHRVETFGSAEAFIEHADLAAGPACLLLDLQLPTLSGLALQGRIGTMLPIIFISGQGTLELAVAAMKAGAADFLSKPIAESTLLQAIERVFERAWKMFEWRAERAEIRRRVDHLTRRERQVMALVIEGRLNKQIASELGAAEKTIKIHRARVMEKMKARSLAELVRLGDRHRSNPTEDD
ncbi:LuxR family two component transcriptional regulator [Paraburkholderia sp. BL27I4N3]|uniref:response regulator transcription factor n=1 Tax=Paraburkholderia sp. BL27I4N3 TaxID=1938805 RepID=UPI000E229811|nr:response regulator [Paraburkholderia sp. BL27I4N3]REE18356.1 LuxR family two component transcriptional regulator [Paraburkholderia sp. BL27I4N3]